MTTRRTIADLPPKCQDEIAARIGKGKPLGMARAKELRAVQIGNVGLPKIPSKKGATV
jgi:hypothetical protein